MSKKDYISMARRLRSEKERIMHGGDTEDQQAVALAEWKLMTQIIVEFFQEENPLFDTARFSAAINGGVKTKHSKERL
jgi:hypothetical protein